RGRVSLPVTVLRGAPQAGSSFRLAKEAKQGLRQRRPVARRHDQSRLLVVDHRRDAADRRDYRGDTERHRLHDGLREGIELGRVGVNVDDLPRVAVVSRIAANADATVDPEAFRLPAQIVRVRRSAARVPEKQEGDVGFLGEDATRGFEEHVLPFGWQQRRNLADDADVRVRRQAEHFAHLRARSRARRRLYAIRYDPDLRFGAPHERLYRLRTSLGIGDDRIGTAQHRRVYAAPQPERVPLLDLICGDGHRNAHQRAADRSHQAARAEVRIDDVDLVLPEIATEPGNRSGEHQAAIQWHHRARMAAQVWVAFSRVRDRDAGAGVQSAHRCVARVEVAVRTLHADHAMIEVLRIYRPRERKEPALVAAKEQFIDERNDADSPLHDLTLATECPRVA